MNTFKYRAQGVDGKSCSGVVEAYDEYAAVEELRRTYPVIDNITPVGAKRKVPLTLNEPMTLSDRTLSLVSSQFAIMLRAGLPMNRVVELVANQTSDKLMKRILNSCAEDVAAGCGLAGSLEKFGNKVPAVFIETVRAGEESGTLERSFERLKIYYDRAHKTRAKVRRALTYPVIVILLAIVTVAIVMVKLVPDMIDSFAQLGAELPTPTRILIAISNFFVKFWPWLLGGFCVLAVGGTLFGRTERGKLFFSHLRLKLPVLGKISRMNTAAQTANTMTTLLAAGLPVSRATGIVSRVLYARCAARDLERCVPRLEAGETLLDTLRDVPDLPEMLVEMAGIGETSGSLEETLGTVGQFYEEEAMRASDQALAMIEPMLTVILGVFVGFIVIAIYMPMFSMYNGFGVGSIRAARWAAPTASNKTLSGIRYTGRGGHRPLRTC